MADDPKASGGPLPPDRATVERLQEYYDRTVDLNDQLRYTSTLKEDTYRIDKETINVSNQLVNAARKLKDEYTSVKDVSKDINAIKNKTSQIEKVHHNLAKDLTQSEKNRIELYVHQGNEINKIKKGLEKLQEQERAGVDVTDKKILQNEILLYSQQRQSELFNSLESPAAKQVAFTQKTLDVSNEIVAALEKEEARLLQIEKSLGLSGQSLKVMNKLLGGALGSTDEILNKSRERIALLQKENQLQGGLAGKMQGFGVVVGEVGKSIMKNLNDPLVYLAAGLSWDTSVVKLQKSLAVSREEAAILRDDITDIAAYSGDAALNAERIQKAYMNLNQAFGVASADLLKNHGEVVEQSAVLQERWGLSAESTAELAKAAIVAGKPLEQIKLDIIGSVKAAEAQYGAHLNIKEVTEAVGKVTGQVRAQLAGNPALIAEAVAVAKELGFELEQVAKSANTFLDFESSISAELEAELLTGKQLNLEIARSAALTGDYKTVAEEVAKNVGGWADFTKMNVIQQQKLAAAVGMTADELSNSLMDQENLKQLAEEARAAGDEDLAKQIEARDAQQQFADAVEKIKGIFVDLVGGPVGQLLTVIAEIVSVISGVLAPILNVVFTPIKMIVPYLDTILKTTLLIVGAYQTLRFLGDQQYRTTILTGVAKKLNLMTDNEAKASILSSSIIQKGTLLTENQKELVKKRSLATTIKTNIAEKWKNVLGKIGLIDEQGKFAIAQQGWLLQIKKNASIVWENTLKALGLQTSIETAAVEKTSWLTSIKKGLALAWNNTLKVIGNLLKVEEVAIEETSLGLAIKQRLISIGRNALEATMNTLKIIGNVIGKRGLLMDIKKMFVGVGRFVMNMFSAGAKAPFPLSLVLPFIMGGIAGALGMAMYAKFAKADDMVSGYGKQGYFKEGEVTLLNDNDQVAAGTDLFGKEKPTPPMAPPSPPSPPPTQQVQEKVVVVESKMKYDGFAATNINNWDSATNSARKFNSVSYDYDTEKKV